jgi:Ca2+-binding RTX toxin-like protein
LATVTLTPEHIGRTGDTDVYRIELSQSGLTSIHSITIRDDSVISGGTGSVSGFDLEFIKLSGTATTSATAVGSLLAEDASDFSGAGVGFQPGVLQPWSPDDSSSWNQPYLAGTKGNAYSPDKATLGALDGNLAADTGLMSLGEGGWLSLLLKYAISTNAKYLYIGDWGAGSNDGFSVALTGEAAPGQNSGGGVPLPQPGSPTAIRITGTSDHDIIMLGKGVNQHIGTGNDTTDGLAGNDRLGGAGGDDWVYGGSGRDRLFGGDGNDVLQGGRHNDTIHEALASICSTSPTVARASRSNSRRATINTPNSTAAPQGWVSTSTATWRA